MSFDLQIHRGLRAIVVVACFALGTPDGASAQVTLSPADLPESYWNGWRTTVDHLLTPTEVSVLESLTSDAERLGFVEAFWSARDPTPGSTPNEARNRFLDASTQAHLAYPRPGDPRAEAIRRFGLPYYRADFGDCYAETGNDVREWSLSNDHKGRCTLPHLDLMFFDEEGLGGPISLLFYRRDGECRRLRAGEPLIPGGVSNELLLERLQRQGCFDANPGLRRYLERAIAEIPTDEELAGSIFPLTGPAVSSRGEIHAFAQTIAPTARLQVAWRGRVDRTDAKNPWVPVAVGERLTTAVAVLRLEATSLGTWEEELPWRTMSLQAELVDLERQTTTRFALDRNFFDRAASHFELAFDLEARHGPHILLLRIHEADRYFDPIAFELAVPEEVPDPPPGLDSTRDLLAALATAPTIRLPERLGGLVTGKTKVEVSTTGSVAAVIYRLGEEEVARSSEPPFEVEIDFGEVPLMRTIEAVAETTDGRPLARDRLSVNPGAQRFHAELLDLQPISLSADRVLVRPRVQLSIPDGSTVERVELFSGEMPLSTLHSPPWAQVVEVELGPTPTVLRAVVRLDDGRSREAVGLVGTDALSNRVIEDVDVDLVEVFASVTGKGGRAVEDLSLDEIRVLEDGKPQEIREFRRVRDLPMDVVLLLDTSTSMAVRGALVKNAAAKFLTDVVSEKDRAALIEFDNVPRVVVPLTSDRERLTRSVKALWISGGTAFRDSVVTSLHYLSGGRGRRAVVVLTDGIDEHSLLSVSTSLEYAQRAGVAIYTIGLGLNVSDPFRLSADGTSVSWDRRRKAQRALYNLATSSGGLSFLISTAEQLPEVYEKIEQDLRSQYLLTFQSEQQGEGFRRLTVKVSRRGTKVRSAAGYYP